VLQDSQLLEPHMNLVEQCVQGEGLVQINVELKSEGGIKKINIVDVLKPADDNLRQKMNIFLSFFLLSVFDVLLVPGKMFWHNPDLNICPPLVLA
jgi:hypothetical protein